jgi:hypothetical protein
VVLCSVSSHTVQRCSGNTGSCSCIISQNFGMKTGRCSVSEGYPVPVDSSLTATHYSELAAYQTLLRKKTQVNPQLTWMSAFVTCEPSYFGMLRAKVLFSVTIITHNLFACSQLPRDDNHVSGTFRWSLLPHCLFAFVNIISACIAVHDISFSSLSDICLGVL